jgi:hypothetical protein
MLKWMYEKVVGSQATSRMDTVQTGCVAKI